MERFNLEGNFEKNFSLAFDQAEIVPSPHVWEKVEVTLLEQATSTNKKRLLFFQLVAAASLIFAASIGLYNTFFRDGDVNKPDASSQAYSKSELEGTLPSDKKPEESLIAIVPEEPRKKQTIEENTPAINLKDGLPDKQDGQETNNFAPTHVPKWELENRNDVSQIAQRSPFVQRDIQAFQPSMVPFWVKASPKRDEKSTIWAKAAFTSGSFKASSPGGLVFGAADAEAALDAPTGTSSTYVSTSDNPGNMYSGGFGLGGKISSKWILEGGLSYVKSEFQANTNSVEESNGTLYPVYHQSSFNGDVSNVSNYSISNSMNFLSIPLKAGYLIIDKKIGWLASGGISSNIMLANSINSDQYQNVNLSSDQSPFRPVSWSALMGTEVYYRFATYYQVSIFPQYQMGLTEITKPDANFDFRPNSLSIGVSLRYLFK